MFIVEYLYSLLEMVVLILVIIFYVLNKLIFLIFFKNLIYIVL